MQRKLKQVKTALNQSEQSMKTFVHDSLLCIYFFNTETKKIIYANPSFCQLLGYLPEDIDKLTIYNFLNHPKESVDSFINHVIQTKQRSIGERQWKRKDGKLIDMFVNASYGDHKDSDTIYIAAQDISERKEAGKALIESEARLKQGERIARFGNWKLVLDRQMVYSTSEGARKIYGTDKIELSLEDVKKFVLPEYRQKMDDALKALINEGKPYNVEFKIKRANDEEIVAIQSIAEYNPETRIIFGVLTDITERKKAEEEQKKYIEKLSEIAFLQSHQVRSPIASILGLIQLINFEKPEDPQNMEVLFHLKKTTIFCDRVIKEIIDKTSEIEQLNKKL